MSETGPGANVAQDEHGYVYSAGGGGVSQFGSQRGAWFETPICIQAGCIGTDSLSRISITPSGVLYGTSSQGGIFGGGAVYEIAPTPSGWKEPDLYDLGGYKYDGQGAVNAQLALDSKGNLYGVTDAGGRNNCDEVGCGTIYELTRETSGEWKETILYNFRSPSAGAGYNPVGGVILDKAGNLYGTTGYGGGPCGCGVVYRLSPTKNGEWNYTVLHTFENSDGVLPAANLTIGPDGNLYGTTFGGGPYGGGVVFEISPQ